MGWSFMGMGYLYLGDHEKARICAEKAIEIHNRAGTPLNAPVVYWVVAEIHEGARDLEEAKKYDEEGLKLSSEHEVKTFEGPILLVLGKIIGKTDRSKVEAAEQYILKGLAIVEELGMKPDVAIGHLYLGELLAFTIEEVRRLNRGFRYTSTVSSKSPSSNTSQE